MNKFKIIIICLMISIITSSCTTLTEGLSGKKKDGSDVFLVKKKNPLVLPPDFEKIPEPGTLKQDKKSEKQKLEEILNVEINENNIKDKASSSEQSILNQIRK